MNALTVSRPVAPVAFDEHPRFHGAVGRAALAGTVAGLALLAVEWFSGPVNLFTPVIVAAAVALVLARWWHLIPVAAVVAALAGLASRDLEPSVFGQILAGAALGALAYRDDLWSGRRTRTLLAALGAGLSTWAGAIVVGRLSGSGVFENVLPGVVAQAGYGASLGLFALLGSSAGHLRLRRDPVELALGRARGMLEGELLALVERGFALYQGARAALEGRGGPREQVASLRAQLQGVACRVIELAERVHTVEQDLGADTEARLAEQIADLERRGASVDDEAARRQYALARRTLEAQADQVRRIRTGGERVVAALHGQLALLERTRLSLVALRSSDSSRMAGEVQSVSDVLADVAREMEAESEAVMELTGQAADVV